MAEESTDTTQVAGPHRIVLAFTAYGTYDELAEVADAMQVEGENRALFVEFAMMNEMAIEEAQELPEDHPMHEMMADA